MSLPIAGTNPSTWCWGGVRGLGRGRADRDPSARLPCSLHGAGLQDALKESELRCCQALVWMGEAGPVGWGDGHAC